VTTLFDKIRSLALSHVPSDAPNAEAILRVCVNLAEFLIEKNAAYGDSALNPLRVMSKAGPAEQIRVRMDDKLSRMIRGQSAGEDPPKDYVGYWVLLQVAEEKPAEEYAPYLHTSTVEKKS
jgi:hypothetical protein